VAIEAMAQDATEYSFAQILSEIKQSHYGWKFVYSVCVEVKDNDGNVLFTAEVENEGRSIAVVAEAAYNDVKTAEEYNALSDAQKALYKYEIDGGKYSQYSNAQRAILKGYFTVS
jgi:hypothetical protein